MTKKIDSIIGKPAAGVWQAIEVAPEVTAILLRVRLDEGGIGHRCGINACGIWMSHGKELKRKNLIAWAELNPNPTEARHE